MKKDDIKKNNMKKDNDEKTLVKHFNSFKKK